MKTCRLVFELGMLPGNSIRLADVLTREHLPLVVHTPAQLIDLSIYRSIHLLLAFWPCEIAL